MLGYVITFVILVICIAVPLVAYYFSLRNKDKPSPSGGDVIVITDEGSTFETQTLGTETYIEMPRRKCYARDTDPSWCGDITPSTEMNYVLDVTGGTIDDDGRWKTSWVRDTNLCADGTQNCIYEENYDENRKLIGITNAQGDDFIQKFIDEIYAGGIELGTRRELFKRQLQKKITFDPTTGKLFVKQPMGEGGETETIEIIPGNTLREVIHEGKINMPVGQMIMTIIFYYYVNDLPKPTIKLNITSQQTLGEVFHALRDERAERAERAAAKAAAAAKTEEGTAGGEQATAPRASSRQL